MLRRAIGFATIVIAVVIVLVLLPRHGEKNESGESTAIPVVAVPIGAMSRAAPAAGASLETVGNTADIRTVPTGVGQTSVSDQTSPETNPEASVEANPGTAQQDVPNAQPAYAADRSGNQARQATRPSRAGGTVAKPGTTSKPDHPEQPQPTRTQTAAAVAGSAYYVQVGSFADNSNANQVLAKLKHLGLHGRVHAAAVGGQTYYRVQAGPYASEDAANTARQRLISRGYKGSRVISP